MKKLVLSFWVASIGFALIQCSQVFADCDHDIQTATAFGIVAQEKLFDFTDLSKEFAKLSKNSKLSPEACQRFLTQAGALASHIGSLNDSMKEFKSAQKSCQSQALKSETEIANMNVKLAQANLKKAMTNLNGLDSSFKMFCHKSFADEIKQLKFEIDKK